MIVLNVGGAANRALPRPFDGWEQKVLDIDERVKPDIFCDAVLMRELLPSATYDAVYSSHTLEHFHSHDVPRVLAGMSHVLKDEGFAWIVVPDLGALFAAVQGKDIGDVWYESPAGPITFHDVLYGWGVQVQQNNLFYAHKCGFTSANISRAMAPHFRQVMTASDGFNLYAIAFKSDPTPEQVARLGFQG